MFKLVKIFSETVYSTIIGLRPLKFFHAYHIFMYREGRILADSKMGSQGRGIKYIAATSPTFVFKACPLHPHVSRLPFYLSFSLPSRTRVISRISNPRLIHVENFAFSRLKLWLRARLRQAPFLPTSLIPGFTWRSVDGMEIGALWKGEVESMFLFPSRW